jgi:hypothetical protein
VLPGICCNAARKRWPEIKTGAETPVLLIERQPHAYWISKAAPNKRLVFVAAFYDFLAAVKTIGSDVVTTVGFT